MSGSRVNPSMLCSRKFCMWFCGISLAVALLMPPIAIFVITPAIAQHIMYNTEISLPNTTTVPCKTEHTWLMNTLKVDVPGIFSASLKPYKTVISTSICGSESDPKVGTSCKDPKIVPMFVYMAPVMDLQAGGNDLRFVVGTNLTGDNAKVILTQGFIIPMYSGAKTELIIQSDDIDMVAGLKVLGIQFGISVKSMKLKNKLTCSFVKPHPEIEIPDKYCHPSKSSQDTSSASSGTRVESGRRLDSSEAFELSCVPGAPKVQSSMDFFA